MMWNILCLLITITVGLIAYCIVLFNEEMIKKKVIQENEKKKNKKRKSKVVL